MEHQIDQIVTTSYGGSGEIAGMDEVREALPWLSDPSIAEVDLSAPWLIQVHWRWTPGESPQPVRIDIRGRDDQPITVPMFNKLPISKILDQSRGIFTALLEVAEFVALTEGEPVAAAALRDGRDTAKPRRGRKSGLLEENPNLLVDVARYYREERLKGTRRIIKAVHNRLLEDPTYTALMQDWGSEIDNRVRGWIDRAKQQKLIDGERKETNG